MRTQMRFAGVVFALVLGACRPHDVERPKADAAPLPALLDAALAAEAREPALVTRYLDAIDSAVHRWNDPWAAPVVAAALDELVWRRTAELPRTLDHAVAHRSREGLAETTARLLTARERAATHPILGPMLAFALHELALRTGAEPEANLFRQQAGCISRAAALGPLAWPALSSLDGTLPIPVTGAMPDQLAGVGPFAHALRPETSYADACALDFAATGTNGGLRALVLDVVQPAAGWVYVAAGARSPIRVDLGGATVVRRSLDTTNGNAILFGRAWVEAGRARLVVRVAPQEPMERVTLQLVDEHGGALATLAPAPGDVATARASRAATLELIPEARTPEEFVTAASAELALGLDRRASRRLEQRATSPGDLPPHVELLRMRALRAADEFAGGPLDNVLRSAAERVHERCPDCWEARLAKAQTLLERQGAATGTFAALAALGVDRPQTSLLAAKLSAPELAYVAVLADQADVRDVARQAYEALRLVAEGSPLAADLDALLFSRVGQELVQASCQGGLSRAGSNCLMALLGNDDLDGALAELERLRRLRGAPSLFRKLELTERMDHGRLESAASLYDALPAAERDSTLLALLDKKRGKSMLTRDLATLGDAPFGFEPLVRMLGVIDDPAPALETEGAALVAHDRAEAFLPGAGTAVLRHLERYEVNERGLLFYWTYDLRRVSDTEDVASSAEADEPRVMGQWTSRTLRRRIHKRDGRVLDPDPNARGSQGHTDLSQLEKGDYVERIGIGWALPEEHGQLVVDGPDAMPERTSVREATVELIRPQNVPMKVWSHALLGDGTTVEKEGKLITRWSLSNQAPRRLELDVPPLEALVSVSFGTDDYARIGRALGENLRMRDEADPYLARFVADALGANSTPLDDKTKLARLTAAVGKRVKLADPRSITDHVASISGVRGDLARDILERGEGSRTWVLHRALREAGIASRIGIAETRPWSASPRFPPHIGRFTRPLVQATLGTESVWIDADVEGPPLPPGRISPELRGRTALFGDGSMTRVEGTTEEDADAIELLLDVNDQGQATGTFRAELHGRTAQRIAGALETLVGEQRTNLLRSIVLGWAPWADVREVQLTSDEGSWQIAVTARIAPSSFAEIEDKKLGTWSLPGLQPFHSVLPRPQASTLAARYTAQADRASALAVDAPLYYRVHRRVTLPAGAKLSRPAPTLTMTTADGGQLTATRAISQDARGLDEVFELNMPIHVVEASDFDAFVTRLRKVDEGFGFSTRALFGGK